MISMSWRTAGLLALVACSLSTQAVQTVPTGQLQLSGPGPYYQLHLPLTWQAQADTAQAHQVRISNALGEALPYAWAHAPVVAETLQDVRLNWFKWAGPKQHVWVLDTRHLPGHVQQLQLTLPNGQSGMFAFAVDRSEDLQTWARVLPSAQVIRLTTAQGQQLEQTTLVLGSMPPGYLRLRLLPGSPVPVLGDVNVVYSQGSSHMPEWSWSGPLQASRCTATYCDFNVPHQIPLARIKLNLPQVNTVLNLQVLGKPLAQQQQHPHHGLRKRLRALRDKAHGDPASLHTASQDQQDWRWINEGQAYWIQQGTQHLRNDELQLDMGNYHQLRIQTISGASAWTHTRPTLMVATPERTLVFLTKGPAPYRFSWAAPGGASTAMELGQLMPAGTSLAMGQAQLSAIALPTQTTANVSPAKTPQAVASQVSGVEQGIPNAWWLWAALLLGLGLMAYMARVLLSSKPQGE